MQKFNLVEMSNIYLKIRFLFAIILDICSIISYFQNPWNTILGDCSVVDQYLLDKPVWSLKWFIPHYLNVLLRAAGQVSLHLWYCYVYVVDLKKWQCVQCTLCSCHFLFIPCYFIRIRCILHKYGIILYIQMKTINKWRVILFITYIEVTFLILQHNTLH